jgi:PIN domain nuclease of toxin-antitoxin system
VKFLLDTHVFLWLMQDKTTMLSEPTMVALHDERNRLYLSTCSWWEICIKTGIGKLELATGWQRAFRREMRRNSIEWLTLLPEHAEAVIDLPMIHRDPFDRLLIAQAQCEKMTLVSADRHIPKYDLSVLT